MPQAQDGLCWKYRPQTSIYTALCHSTGHGRHHGFRWQHRADTCMAFGDNSVLGGSMDHGHQRGSHGHQRGSLAGAGHRPRYGSQQQHKPQAPTQSSLVAQPWTSTWSSAAVRTTDSHMKPQKPQGFHTAWYRGTWIPTGPPGIARTIEVFQEGPIQKRN